MNRINDFRHRVSVLRSAQEHPNLTLRKDTSVLVVASPFTIAHGHVVPSSLPLAVIQDVTKVHPVALAADGMLLNLIPLHGISQNWTSVLHLEESFHPSYPGYFTSKNGPKMANEDLDATQARIVSVSGLQSSCNFTFYGEKENTNLFARIVRGEIEQWPVWEDNNHIAFLTPFGNTPGFTVLVPRRCLSSDVFRPSEEDYNSLVERVGIFFEGFEIDYTHAKLIPAHPAGDDDLTSEGVAAAPYFDTYPGYITTQPGPPAQLGALNALSETLRAVLSSSASSGAA